jgi:hypothetical protein
MIDEPHYADEPTHGVTVGGPVYNSATWDGNRRMILDDQPRYFVTAYVPGELEVYRVTGPALAPVFTHIETLPGYGPLPTNPDPLQPWGW